jgi:TetR/AcrR family transcriptional regulator
MGTGRDLNRTRERILAAGLAEFSAHGFAGARTDAIAQRGGVNERMIFYCFKTKEGLYREVMRRKLAERLSLVESSPNDDFASRLAKGYELACSHAEGTRMLEWEALASGKRKLVYEDERRALFKTETAQLRRAKVRGQIPSDSNEQMLVLISFALRIAPLAFPQITWLISGMEPVDPKFRRKWMKSLRWVGERIAGQPRPQPQRPAAPEPPSEVAELVQ